MREQIRPASASVAPSNFPATSRFRIVMAMLSAIAEGASQDCELFERRGLPVDAGLHAGARN